MGRRVIAMLVVSSLWAAACGSENVEDAPSLATDTVDAPDDPGSSPPLAEEIDQDVPTDLGRTRGQRVRWNWPRGHAFTEGKTIEVSFNGGAPGEIERSKCAHAYEIEVVESDAAVTVSVYALRPATPPDEDPDVGCTDEGHGWRLSAELENPVGARDVRDGSDGTVMLAISMETLLEPTWIPNDWVETNRGSDELPPSNRFYGSPDGSSTWSIQVSTSTIQYNPRLHGLRSNDYTDNRAITVRREDDGVAATMFDGRQIVGFEEQGWYYRIVGEAGVGRDTLIEFARGFERPAIVAARTSGSSSNSGCDAAVVTSQFLEFQRRRYDLGDRVGPELTDIRDALPPDEASAPRWSDHLAIGGITAVEEGFGFAWPRTEDGAPRVQLDFGDPEAEADTAHVTMAVDSTRSMATLEPLASELTFGVVLEPGTSIGDIREDLLSLGRVAVFLVDSPAFDYQPELLGVARDGTLLGVVNECGRLAFPATAGVLVPQELTASGLLAFTFSE